MLSKVFTLNSFIEVNYELDIYRLPNPKSGGIVQIRDHNHKNNINNNVRLGVV